MQRQFKFTNRVVNYTDITFVIFGGMVVYIFCMGLCFIFMQQTNVTYFKMAEITGVCLISVLMDYVLFRPFVIAFSLIRC